MSKLFPTYSIGHFINEPLSRTDFEILRFSDMEEPNVDEYHRHTFYEILWTEKGVSRQIIDYNLYEVKPNTLFFISPNQVHHFEEWRPLRGGTIMFTEDFYLLRHADKNILFELSFLDNLYTNPCVEFSKAQFANILKLIHSLEVEHKRTDKNSTILQAYLHVLLAEVQRQVDLSNDVAGSKKYLVQFKKFKAELEAYFAENHTSSFYAHRLNITQHHLNLICKEIANATATEVIRARSVLEAKRLLTFTSKTISQIADDLNYTDSSYFAKTFKIVTGQSPHEFKYSMSGKYRL